MKVRFSLKDLQARLDQLSHLSGKGGTPIYSYVRLVVNGPMAVMTAIAIGSSLDVVIPVKESIENGSVLLPLKTVQEILPSLPVEDVTISAAPDRTLLKGGSYTATLVTLPVDDFDKQCTEPDSYKTIATLGLPGLKALIERVVFAVPKVDGKYTVVTALVHSVAKQLRLVATDGHRMAIAKQNSDAGSEFTIQLPKTALELTAILSGGSTVTVGESDGSFQFTTTGDDPTARPVERLVVHKTAGTFPPYEKVLPADTTFKTRLMLAQSAFLFALNQQLPLADKDGAFAITFAYAADSKVLSLKAENPALGFAFNDSIDVTGSGPAFEFRINGSHLKDFVERAEGEIQINVASSASPIDFRNADIYEYLLAPLALTK